MECSFPLSKQILYVLNVELGVNFFSISIIDSVFSCQQLMKVRANIPKRSATIASCVLTGQRGIEADLRMCTRSGSIND